MDFDKNILFFGMGVILGVTRPIKSADVRLIKLRSGRKAGAAH